MKPLTIAIVFLGVAGFISCGAKGDKNRDTVTVVINNSEATSDEASAGSMESAASEQRHRPSARDRHKIRITDAYCNHQLGNQAGNNYHPLNMTDGNPATAWAAKVADIEDYSVNGIIVGPVFDLARSSKIAGVELQNGYCKNSASFRNNSRASWVTVYRYHPEWTDPSQDEGEINTEDIIYEGPIKDVMTRQYFPVSPRFDNSQPTVCVGLLFRYDRIRKGAKWNDLCLSEIAVFGK